MAEEEVVLASAVVVPEPEPEPSPSPPPPPMNGSLKRRQPSIASTDSKRPRISPNDDAHRRSSATSPPPANGTASRARPVRNASGQEERQRGKRLFGALLGNLGQSRAPSATQRRRAEIEQKQQDKLRQQEEEDEAEKRERLRRLEGRRRREQWGWEEGSMKARHRSMRARAGMLKTKAEPVLYYLPYETTREEELEIGRQRDEVEDVIDAEVAEFDERRASASGHAQQVDEAEDPSHEAGAASTNGDGNKTHSEDRKDSIAEAGEAPARTRATMDQSNDIGPDSAGSRSNEPSGAHSNAEDAEGGESSDTRLALTASSHPDASHDAHRDAHDDAGEVVEGDEDAVIY